MRLSTRASSPSRRQASWRRISERAPLARGDEALDLPLTATGAASSRSIIRPAGRATRWARWVSSTCAATGARQQCGGCGLAWRLLPARWRGGVFASRAARVGRRGRPPARHEARISGWRSNQVLLWRSTSRPRRPSVPRGGVVVRPASGSPARAPGARRLIGRRRHERNKHWRRLPSTKLQTLGRAAP